MSDRWSVESIWAWSTIAILLCFILFWTRNTEDDGNLGIVTYISHTVSVLKEAGKAYPSGAPEFTPGSWWGPSSCIYKKHGECLIRSRKCLPFRSFRVHTRVLVETVLLTFLVFCVKANIRYIENEVIDLIINPIRKRKSNSSILYNGIWYETNVSNFTPFWLPVWYLQNLFYVI